MSERKLMVLVGAVALFGAMTPAAYAESAKGKSIDFTVRDEVPALAPQGTEKSVKWDARKGRWGVTLNLTQPGARDVQLNDVQAGAYFRITPSLRVGGAVALAEKTPDPTRKIQPNEGQPRVRLETAFRF